MSGVRPLEGYRVLACEVGLAGPLCSRLLVDFGADVIKIERPGSGDVTRGWDTGAAGLATGFVWMNRGKRSAALDLRAPDARSALERLIERSDVFLVNLSPGWAGRMRLTEADVRAIRPDIVYTEITGYGTDGPYAQKNAYDLIVQGEAGLIALNGTEEQPARIAVPVCDIGAGTYAALGTLAALLRRRETGEGERVSVSLFDVMVDWIGYYPHFWWHRGETPRRMGVRHPLFVPYGPFRAKDGRDVNLAVLSAEHWQAFCVDVLERPDLYADGRYATVEGRAAHRAELEPALEELLASRPASEWIARLERAEIPCGAVNDLPGVLSHPQLEHNRLLTEVDSPVGTIPTVGSPIAFAGERPALGAVPALGAHTREVLAEVGFEDGEIAALERTAP